MVEYRKARALTATLAQSSPIWQNLFLEVDKVTASLLPSACPSRGCSVLRARQCGRNIIAHACEARLHRSVHVPDLP